MFFSEKRRQETRMDEQGASSKTQMEEKSLQNAERGTGHLAGIQEHCQSMQGSNEEG